MILKAGLLRCKRTKTIKERYFIILSDPVDPNTGRLEYYESEKKFRHGSPYKASIILKDCFNISRKHGTKEEDHMIFIFTKEECYTLYFDDEILFKEWLTLLIKLTEPHVNSSRYERVWQVTIPKNQNSERENLIGTYRLCLTNDKKLHLVKVAPNDPEPVLHELPLSCVRRFSHNKKYFIVELGRGAALGAGNLCMLTDDGATTHDMHESILRIIDYQPSFLSNGVSTNGSLQNLRTPIHHSETSLRPRSASTSECCRPITFSGRRISRENTIGGSSFPQNIPIGTAAASGNNCSGHSSGQSSQSHSLTSPSSYYATVSIRERCDSLPSNCRPMANEGKPPVCYRHVSTVNSTNDNINNNNSSLSISCNKPIEDHQTPPSSKEDDADEINGDYVPMKPLNLSSAEALEKSVKWYFTQF